MFIVPTLFGERHLNSLPAANVSNITQQNISLGNVAKSLFAGLISNLHKYLNDFILEKKKTIFIVLIIIFIVLQYDARLTAGGVRCHTISWYGISVESQPATSRASSRSLSKHTVQNCGRWRCRVRSR